MPMDASDDGASGLRAFPLPADTGRDTKILGLFPPSTIPALLAAGITGVVALVFPGLAVGWKLLVGLLFPGAVITGLATDAPSKARRWHRFLSDSPGRYIGHPTPGHVRAQYPDGSLGVALAVLPPPAVGRDGASFEAERVAWVHVARRLKAGRTSVAISVEMVPDAPPEPGWEVPPDIALPTGVGRFATLRREHFARLVASGRAMRPQVLLRCAGAKASWGRQPELHLDRLVNGVAGELQAVDALALPVDFGAVRDVAAAQVVVGSARGDEGEDAWALPTYPMPATEEPTPCRDDGRTTPVGDGAEGGATGAMPTAEAVRVIPADLRAAEPEPVSAVPSSIGEGVPILTPTTAPRTPHTPLHWPEWRLPSMAVSLARGLRRPPVGRSAPVSVADPGEAGGAYLDWPDLDALAQEAGRTWDIGLCVLGAVPRVGASTALVAWARARPDGAAWTLVDANLGRPGGVAFALGGEPAGGPGWRNAPQWSGPTSIGGMRCWEPGRPTPEEEAERGVPAMDEALVAACRSLRERNGGLVAVDLGSPDPVDGRMHLHPLLRLAARDAAAVAVVTRQDAQAVFAARRMLGALDAAGAREVVVWVAAYDTADPVTLAELRGVFGCEVAEAPSLHAAPGAGTVAAADPVTGLPMRADGEALLRHLVAGGAPGGAALSVLFLDVDDLKRTNDTEGHAAGDHLLRAFADAARPCLRRGDALYRWGGDEFVAVLPGAGEAAARAVLERIRRAAPPCSIGGAARVDGETVDSLLGRADAAMYQDKRRRKAGRTGAP